MTRDICCGVTPLEATMLKKIGEHLEEIVSQGGELHFKKGHVIFYEGHKPYGFYLLKKGTITLSRFLMNNDKEELVGGEQEVFGLFHLLTNTPHCAMAVAKTDVVALFIPKSAVIQFLNRKGIL